MTFSKSQNLSKGLRRRLSGLNLSLLIAASLTLTVMPAQAQVSAEMTAAEQAEELIQMALDGTYGYDFTKELTTDLGPRLAGSPEEAKARDWTVEKFKDMGFQNVRIEPFTVPGWVRGEEHAEIISPNPQPLYVTALGGSVPTPEGGVEAEIAYFPTFDALTASPDSGLEGKIVFISGRMDRAHDGAGYGPANRKRQSGATEAAKRGAVAVVIRSVGTDSHRFPHTGQMRYDDTVKKIPIGALSAPDADQLERTLEAGATVTLKLVLTPQSVGELPSGNVVGEIPGSEKPEEIIVIGGHLDSWDLGTGAIDDAAGIGITAGAAKVILDAGLTPKRTIRIVAFGAEEIGLKGGFAYADQHKDDLKNHVLASESDFGAGPVYALRASVSESASEAVADIHGVISDLGIAFEEGETNGGPDIYPMSTHGVPTIRLQQDGTDYFDLHHTPDDTFDKIVPAEMAQNVAAWAAMIWMASETEADFRPPQTSDLGTQ